jgi:hypothetical protein
MNIWLTLLSPARRIFRLRLALKLNVLSDVDLRVTSEMAALPRMEKLKVLPSPNVFFTLTDPPINSGSIFQIANPSSLGLFVLKRRPWFIRLNCILLKTGMLLLLRF